MEGKTFEAPDGLTWLILTPPLILRQIYVTRPKSTGMTLRSQSRESRLKVIVSAEIHTERSGFASRPEPEVTRPEVEIAPVANPSFGSVAVVDSRSQSV